MIASACTWRSKEMVMGSAAAIAGRKQTSRAIAKRSLRRILFSAGRNGSKARASTLHDSWSKPTSEIPVSKVSSRSATSQMTNAVRPLSLFAGNLDQNRSRAFRARLGGDAEHYQRSLALDKWQR